MSAAPAVSVCIRACDRPDGLRRAISSALAQTAGDLEVVVSDDSRRLARVAESFGDRRVRYFANPSPAGPAANLSAVIGHARGDVLAVLNDDDYWLPGYLEAVRGVLDAESTVGVVFAGAWLEFGDRRRLARLPYPPGRQTRFVTEILGSGIPASGFVLRRSVWEAGERELPLRPDMVGDLAVLLRATAAGHAFHYVQEPLTVLSMHPGQISWGPGLARRSIATLRAFRFDSEVEERLRRRRLAEEHLARARERLAAGQLSAGRADVRAARSLTPLTLRSLVVFSGLRKAAVRAGTRWPRAFDTALTIWGRLRPGSWLGGPSGAGGD